MPENPPQEKVDLKTVHNCWTVYDEKLPDGNRFAGIGRPQDWGDPKWMYRVYTLEAQGYRNIVHCWTDAKLNEHQHLERFASLICQIMLPGWEENRSTNKYLWEDDFWSESWGQLPKYAPELDLDDDIYNAYEPDEADLGFLRAKDDPEAQL